MFGVIQDDIAERDKRRRLEEKEAKFEAKKMAKEGKTVENQEVLYVDKDRSVSNRMTTRRFRRSHNPSRVMTRNVCRPFQSGRCR